MVSKEPSSKKVKTKVFQHQWYDDFPDWKTWVKECPSDSSKFFCVACNENLACGRAEIERHSKTVKHLKHIPFLSVRCGLVNSELASETPLPSAQPEANSLSSTKLTFNERVKSAEIQFACFLFQHNISVSTAPLILSLFQELGKDPAVLQNMCMGKTKASAIINKLNIDKSNRVAKMVRKTKKSHSARQ